MIYPDNSLDAAGLADGAFEIGGGSENWGQDYTESGIKNLVKVPAPTVSNMLQVLEDSLGTIPLEGLAGFDGIVQGGGDFSTKPGAISAIMGSLNDFPKGVLTPTFEDFVGNLFDTFVQGFSGSNDGGFTITDFFNTASAQKKELDLINAGLAALRSDVAANNNSGRTIQVAVSDYETAVPTVFTQAYAAGSGTITNDGDTLEMSNEDFLVMYRYTPTDLITDYFETSMVVPRQSGNWFGLYGERSLFWVGRGNIGWTDLVFARLNGNKLSVGCVSGGMEGTYTYFGSGGTGSGPAVVTIPTGSYMTFRGGTIAGDRVFQFLVGNAVVATFVDTGATSLLGPLYRWTGFGMWNESGPDWVNRSANVSHFVANDNQPAPVVGQGGTMVRLTPVSVGLSAGVFELPPGFFDSTEEIGGGLEYDVAAGTFTVEAGWWTISAGVEIGTAWGEHFNLLVYRDGIAWKHMTTDKGFNTNFFSGAVKPDRINGSFTGYFNEDTEISLGYASSASFTNALVGSADGSATYFTIAKVG